MHTYTQQRWKRRWRQRGRELSSAGVHAYTGGGGGKRAAVAAAERRASGAAAWPWTRRRRWGCPEAQARAPLRHLSDVLPERLDPTAQAFEARSGTHARIAPAR